MKFRLVARCWTKVKACGASGLLACIATPLSGQETISGLVLDSLGTPLSGAQITLAASGSRARSNSLGEFRLRTPTGSFELQARRLGYRPTSLALTVQPGANPRVEIRLVALPLQLPSVEVRRRAEAYDSRLAGFIARKERNIGHFVTREKLDRMSSARFVDALREVPGVQLRSIRGGGTTLALRGSRCPPLVFLDGFPAGAGVMDLEMIDLASVEGVEIYSGVATVPPEFTGARGTHGCGVIAVWSRPTRPRRQRVGVAGDIDLEKLLATHAVYTSDQLDEPAKLTPGSAEPVYPDSLWRAGVAGRVVVEFILDTEGRIEPGSLRIVTATHPYFASAVQTALGDAVFRRASLQGKAVRQIVQLPFDFTAEPRSSSSSPGF
jgi:hypothetical protein